MKSNPSFLHFDWKAGLIHNDTRSAFPSALYGLTGEQTFDFRTGSTYFIYQYEGQSWINSTYPLTPGHYASWSDPQTATDGSYISGSADCKAIIIERIGTAGVFNLGGPIERTGRLKYIDGCTDSLLISPWKMGEPCLNHLHFPAGIDQTPHTHPSIRIGLVARGHGECITPWGDIPLVPGMIFAILPEPTVTSVANDSRIWGEDGELHTIGTHAFRTGDSTMDVIAFHPDSDFGPTDEDHPMINRTIVAGLSAKHIENIRTK